RQPSTKAVQSALMPRRSDHLVKSAIRLERQSTTVPNTSNTSAFTADNSDMSTPCSFVIPRCAIAHCGCANRARVYPSSADMIVQVGNSRPGWRRLQMCGCTSGNLEIPGSFASLTPPNDSNSSKYLAVLDESEIVSNLIVE